jgi:Rrf2 family nitric oxide-sensitive transcriptional repressor
MRLTSFTDYSLRTLLHLSASRDKLVTIQDIADMHKISKNHLMKVVYELGQSGLVETVRGRNGGLRLGRDPAEINIGALVRQTESDFFIAECFDQSSDACPLTPGCKLKGVLAGAMRAFLAELDKVTLADVMHDEASPGGAQILQFIRGAAHH